MKSMNQYKNIRLIGGNYMKKMTLQEALDDISKAISEDKNVDIESLIVEANSYKGFNYSYLGDIDNYIYSNKAITPETNMDRVYDELIDSEFLLALAKG